MTDAPAADPLTRLNAALPAAGASVGGVEPTVLATHWFPEMLAGLGEGN